MCWIFLFHQGYDGIHWMAIAANSTLHATVDDFDDGQNYNDNNKNNNYNNS